jgi:hypothetical protein
MCLDKAGMEWPKAWMGKTQPPPGVGFGYMLMGGSDASNDDPHAMKPAAGKKWGDTGAHVMVLNPGPMADAYPRAPAGFPLGSGNEVVISGSRSSCARTSTTTRGGPTLCS